MASSYTRRDSIPDLAQDFALDANEFTPFDVGFHSDHSAANINSNGIRHHGPVSLNHAADRWAVAEVSVGHESHVPVEDRHAGDLLCLFPRFVVKNGRPRFHNP